MFIGLLFFSFWSFSVSYGHFLSLYSNFVCLFYVFRKVLGHSLSLVVILCLFLSLLSFFKTFFCHSPLWVICFFFYFVCHYVCFLSVFGNVLPFYFAHFVCSLVIFVHFVYMFFDHFLSLLLIFVSHTVTRCPLTS